MDTAVLSFPCPCGGEHRLDFREARKPAEELLEKLRQEGCVDFHLPPGRRDPRLSLEELWGDRNPGGGRRGSPADRVRGRGRMFGVLVYRDRVSGAEGTLKAFSGGFGEIWEVPGWAPPVFDPREFFRLTEAGDPAIKALDGEIQGAAGFAGSRGSPGQGGETLAGLKGKRRKLSRDLTKKIQGLYVFKNFRGEEKGLGELFPGNPPTGAGDCCAPKLLARAAAMGVEPLSLAEFYFGRDSASGDRRHGGFYFPCREKCRPLMGFLLCGGAAL